MCSIIRNIYNPPFINDVHRISDMECNIVVLNQIHLTVLQNKQKISRTA